MCNDLGKLSPNAVVIKQSYKYPLQSFSEKDLDFLEEDSLWKCTQPSQII